MKWLIPLSVLLLVGSAEATNTPASYAGPTLSLDDPLPAHLKSDVKELEKDFKKYTCPVPANVVGPVRRTERTGKKGKIPGWSIGRGKKRVFVGHRDTRCDFSAFRKPSGQPGRVADALSYLPEKERTKYKMAHAVHQEGIGVLYLAAGAVVTGGGAWIYANPEQENLDSDERTAAYTLIGLGTFFTAVATTLMFSTTKWKKSATEASLRQRRRQSKNSRRLANDLANRCFSPQATSTNERSQKEACSDLSWRVKPGNWDYGSIRGKRPAEIAARVSFQSSLIRDQSSRTKRLKACFDAKPTPSNNSCLDPSRERFTTKWQDKIEPCQILLTELSALGSSGRKLYPVNDLRKAVNALKNQHASCERKQESCEARFGQTRSRISRTFECKRSGMMKGRKLSTAPNRGPVVEVDGCPLYPSPALPTACRDWHVLE